MKNLFFSIVFTIALISCNDTNPSKIETNYYSNADLRFEYPHVIAGDSVVFKRYYVAEDEKNIADDEYAEDIFFTIPTGIESFDYSDAELEQLKIDVKKYCFCGPSNGIEIVDGSISGKLSNNKWQIDADFNFTPLYQVSEDSFMTSALENRTFSASFIKSDIPTD